jgi:hypothetical protein
MTFVVLCVRHYVMSSDGFQILNFTFVHECKFHVYMMVLTFLYDCQHMFSNFKFCNCTRHVYYTTASQVAGASGGMCRFYPLVFKF